MEAIYLHHLGVPCISEPRDEDDSPCEISDIHYLNPEVLIRFEPGGAMITPPMLYSSFIHVDYELLDILISGEIETTKLTKSIYSILIENKIIQPSSPARKSFRSMLVDVTGLPMQALFEVTSDCNCNCDTCYHADDLKCHYPSFKELTKRIDKLKELGIGLFEVTGGEPFLRDDLEKILKYIHFSGLHFYVVTNGYFLEQSSKELIKILSKSLGVAVSLDGIGDVHDKIRQKNGLYVKMIKGLDLMFKQGIEVFLISTINESNLFLVEDMIEIARKYNTTIHLRPTINTGNAKYNSLGKEDLRVDLQPYLNDSNVRNGLLSTKKRIPKAAYYGCGIRKRISVNSYGFIYPCVMDRSRNIINVADYSPEELVKDLNNETALILEMNETCRECEVNKKSEQLVCGGFCRFSNSFNRGVKI